MTAAADMAAFDAMPPLLRRRLAESAFDFPPTQNARDVRRFRLNDAEALAFVDQLERWARRARSSATQTNRREASCPVGELVAAARLTAHAAVPRGDSAARATPLGRG